MKYDMTKPCDACPFKRGSKLQLDSKRVDEIGGQFTTGGQAGFVCHKTAEIDEDSGNFVPKRHDAEGPESRHCAGALIFAEKNGTPSQMMRIAERLGMYDRSALELHHDEVYDDIDDMRAHALDADLPLKSKVGARKRHARSKVKQAKPKVRGKA